jgi:branched-chain amino acid transport system permease protein
MTGIATMKGSRLRPVSRTRLATLAVIVAAFAVFPFVVTDPYLRHLAVLALIYATVAASWDLTLGYAGVFNFAHPALFGVGAYASGIVSARLGLSPWLGIAIGGMTAAALSALIFIPVSRLRGIYVCLITFAAAQLCLYVAVTGSDITGGYLGLSGIPSLTIGGLDLGRNAVGMFYVSGALLVLALVVLRALVNSDFGMSLVALRDFEDYAISRGVSVARQRLIAFVASAVFTGAAGALYTHYLLSISPEVFGFSISTLLLSMVLVGGIATIYGSVVAAIGITMISDMLASLGPWRFVIVAILIIATMRFFPAGLWGLAAQVRTRLSRGSSPPGEHRGGGASPSQVPAGVPPLAVPTTGGGATDHDDPAQP